MLRDARQQLSIFCLGLLLLAPSARAQETATAVSLRSLVPAEAQGGMVYTRNPEREAQYEQFRRVFKVIQEEQLLERIDMIIRSRTPQEKQEEAAEGFAHFSAAVEPASLDALLAAEEIAVAEVYQDNRAQMLLAARMTPEGAKGWFEAMRNLGEMARDISGVDFKLTEEQANGVRFFIMDSAGRAPMTPTAALKDGVLILATTQDLARTAVKKLSAGSTTSKFDDPRVAEALAQLPKGEDMVLFRDGRMEFEQVREAYIPYRKEFQKKADEDEQIAEGMKLMESLLDQAEVLDLEVGVEYTEGNKNHFESLTRLLPGSQEKLGGKLLKGGEPIEQWEKWIPTSALSYSVNSGVDLHGCYKLLTGILSRDAPKINGKLMAKLAEYEKRYDVSLEEDLLEVFSGESVSITLPANQSVYALKCPQPERAKFLFHSVMDKVAAMPQMMLFQPQVIRSQTLEGFEEVVSPMLQANGMQPAIGFKDGWMILASSALAAEEVMDSRWNDAPSIASTRRFQEFGLDAGGAALSASYSNSKEKIRGVANQVESIGLIGPMMLGMAMPNIEPRDMATLQEICALAPSVARVIRSFDFLDSYLAVSQPESTGNGYRKHSVMILQPVVSEEPDAPLP